MSAHDLLRAQLVSSVVERRLTGPPATARDVRRWWRRRVGRGGALAMVALALALCALLESQLTSAGVGGARATVSASLLSVPCEDCEAFGDRPPALGEQADLGWHTARPAGAGTRISHFTRWTVSPELRPPAGEAPIG